MSIEPWNTGTGGTADCEDMPRKSVDIRLTEHPVQQKRGCCALSCHPARTGSGSARNRVKGRRTSGGCSLCADRNGV
ncbi:MAG: hypothetical protein ACLR23_21465 [Clostridia bacterium]